MIDWDPKIYSTIMNSKYFVFLLFFVSTRGELSDPLHDIRERCRVEAGLSVDELANGIHTPENIGPYLLCFGRATGVLTKENNLSKRAIIRASNHIPREILKPMANCCTNQVTKSGVKTPLEKMLVLANCLKKVLGNDLLRVTGYCNTPEWPRLNTCQQGN